MKLAVFDLDDTLLPVDTGNRWPRWVAKCAGLDLKAFDAKVDAFAEAYRAGTFSPEELVRFHTELLARFPRKELDLWRASFIESVVKPALRPEAAALVEKERAAGAVLLLATGTNRYVTEPVARLFGIPNLAAVTPEETPEGEFTGNFTGSHSYGEGKLSLVKDFVRTLDATGPLSVTAYSDSINDLPLLNYAAGTAEGAAVAVNPDPKLRREAEARGWTVLDIFGEAHHV